MILQLPPSGGSLTRPTVLRIFVGDFDRRSDFGATDQMLINLWYPTLNAFLPVAIITDNNDAAYLDLLKNAWAGYPVWTPSLGRYNIFPVDDDQLEVRSRGDVVTADLKVSVSINAPCGILSLPPMTLEFRGLDSPYRSESTITLPSGYTIAVSSIEKPAWVNVKIPAWLQAASFQFAGILNLHETETYIAPPPP